jgi:uncharacterized GH25 family protein
VQTQNGWEANHVPFDDGLSIWPLTRPYGLLPGMHFQGHLVRKKGKQSGLVGLIVEVEKYNEIAPKKLPPDELITFKSRTDAQGSFVTTLPEPGWWGITASSKQFKKDDQNSVVRATYWIHVDEKK